MVRGNKEFDSIDQSKNFGSVEARIKSFSSKWPHTFLNAQILAEAGFHFVGELYIM